MNRLICTTMLLAAVALTGCKREEHPARQRIAIATTIEPLTRAPQLDEEGSGRFADTDRLTLLVSDDAARQKTYYFVLLIENKELTKIVSLTGNDLETSGLLYSAMFCINQKNAFLICKGSVFLFHCQSYSSEK